MTLRKYFNELIFKKRPAVNLTEEWSFFPVLYTELRFYKKYAQYGSCVVYDSHVRCSLALYTT